MQQRKPEAQRIVIINILSLVGSPCLPKWLSRMLRKLRRK